jgi:DNA-binding NtrC family response regulator
MYDSVVWVDAAGMLDAAQADPPDLIVVEHGIDVMPLVDVLRAIKRLDNRVPLIVVAEHTSSQGAIESMREGAYDYLPRETLPGGLEDAARRALSNDGGMIQTIGSPGPGDVAELGNMIGKTPEMIEIHKLIGQVADTDAPVLIQGESGTGKELVARALHYNSSRRDAPFVAVNCSALSPQSLEIDLFGWGGEGKERGPSRTELADGGTIFIDEIDAMELENQGRLLTVLEDGYFERPRSRRRIRTDVRVIAATSASIVGCMKSGEFRVDLFYRLKVVSVFMPPLRDRRDDIPCLAEHFLNRAAAKMRRSIDGISPAAVELLQEYPWPGNVRELEQATQRAVALNRTGVMMPEDFETLRDEQESWPGLRLGQASGLENAVRYEFEKRLAAQERDISRIVVSDVERVLADAAVAAVDGNQVKAARLLGISRNTLRKRVEKA